MEKANIHFLSLLTKDSPCLHLNDRKSSGESVSHVTFPTYEQFNEISVGDDSKYKKICYYKKLLQYVVPQNVFAHFDRTYTSNYQKLTNAINKMKNATDFKKVNIKLYIIFSIFYFF